MISEDPWIWLSAFFTLSMWSMLYKETKFFRLTQHAYIAVTVGHSIVTALPSMRNAFAPLFAGTDLLLIVPLLLGIFTLFIAWRKYSWLAAIPMAVGIGLSTGLSLYSTTRTPILQNIISILGEAGKIVGKDPMTALANSARVVITILALFYFIFTIRLKGPAGNLTKLAKYIMLAVFGFTIGNSLTSYNTYFVTSLRRILVEWLGLA